MLIGVLSDTHDRLPAIRAALEWFAAERVGAVIHAGDVVAPFSARVLAGLTVPLHIVYGNNDGERAGLKAVLPQIVDGPLAVEVGGRRVLVHHFIEWCRREEIEQADIVITGHTHEVVERREEGRLLLNPGECCGWVTGRCTAAVVDTQSLEVRLRELQPGD